MDISTLGIINENHKIIDELKINVNELISKLKGHKVTAKTKEFIKIFFEHHNNYLTLLNSNSNLEKINESASALSTYATAIAQELTKITTYNNEMQSIINKTSVLANKLKESIENREVIFNEDDYKNLHKQSNVIKDIAKSQNVTSEIINHINALKNDMLITEERHTKNEFSLTTRLQDFEKKLDNLEGLVQQRIDKIDSLYLETQTTLEEKQTSVDNLLGTISEGVIARNYESSAAAEKKTANWLRGFSILCMLIITVIISLSLNEISSDNFKWENSIFRFMFTIFLSIPAAYLARESAKHRQQQYAHLQTALDLKAISPYLASLPIEDQHKLKSEIANRLFVPRDYAHTGTDSYPINSHEVLMKILDKVDFKTREKN